jgi:hypothetical protein
MSPATAGNYTDSNTRPSPSGSLRRTAENIVLFASVPIGLSYAVTTQVPFLDGTYHDWHRCNA